MDEQPYRIHTLVRQRAARDDRTTRRSPRPVDGSQSIAILACCEVGDRLACTIRLVDDHEVDELKQPALDALQLVATAGQEQREEVVYEAANCRFGLSHAYRLNQHHIVAGSFKH